MKKIEDFNINNTLIDERLYKKKKEKIFITFHIKV